jgi:hypothetical protein
MWNVPVDHEMFDRISSPQWLWYYFNHAKDQEDQFERTREFVEYHASFIEPQAVQKLRESRNKDLVVSDKDFAESVKDMFGRDVKFQGADQGGDAATNADLLKPLDDMRQDTKGK